MSEALVTHFGDACEFTGVRSEDREAWLAARRTLLTASETAGVLGHGENRQSALSIYVDKIIPQPSVQPDINTRLFWGAALEQTILRTAAAYYGWQYHPGGALLRSKEHKHLACTLDAELDRGDGHGWLDFEGKTTQIPAGWDENTGDLPLMVLIQAQTQLLVTKAPIALVYALIRNEVTCRIEVEPQLDFQQLIVETSGEFMARVERMDPPDPDGSTASDRALKRLYPMADGSIITLPVESVSWTRDLMAVEAELAKLKRRKSELRNMLKKSIGPALYGVLPQSVDGTAVWRRKNNNGSKTRPLLAMRGIPGQESPRAKQLVERALAELPMAAGDGIVRAVKRRRRARR